MFGRFALASLLASVCFLRLAAVWGDAPPQPAGEQLVVLRNGEVLRGQITRQGDRYRVTLADGELRVRVSDVELICADLNDAYRVKRSRIAPDRVDDHLDLAEWCLRQGLPGDAARELSAALVLDPRNPRIELIDRRLQQAMLPPPAPAPAKSKHSAPRVTDEDLDRMVRSLPPLAVETFSTSIQPLLISSCATAGCHGPGAQGDFSLIRIPADRFANRRLTQRNLQTTLAWLDFSNPAQSRLLAVVARPHGGVAAAPFDPQGTKYRQLLTWVGLATERGAWIADGSMQPTTVRPTAAGSSPAAGAGQMPASAAADEDTRPVRPSRRSRPIKTAAPRADGPAGGLSSAAPPVRSPADSSAAGADPHDANALNRQIAPSGTNGQSGAGKSPPN